MDKKFNRWEVCAQDLADLNATKARDLIIKCFFEAQKESIAKGKSELGAEVNDASIMESVRTGVQMAFAEVGGNFEAPDKRSLNMVVEVLARKAKSWRTPQDIIEHHKIQMGKIFQRLS